MPARESQAAEMKGRVIKGGKPLDGSGLAAAYVLMLVLSLGLSAQGQEEWLIAMGDINSYRGTNVPSPDPNGHYWNAVDSGHYFASLTNTTGQATSVALTFDYSNGNDSYNGPAALTFNPNDVVVNNAALGDLGYNWGVYHYYTSSGFEIQGLNPAQKYNLTFFGSHAYSMDNATVYALCTDNGYSNAVTSVSLNVQIPGNTGQWNTNQVAVLNNVSPQANGIMYIGFYGANGTGLHDGNNLGYLNAVEIQGGTNVISSNSTSSFTGGANVPWITYEAENMTNTGTILGPSYAGNNVASESSGRQCVQLSTNGAYVQFVALSNANAIVVRYSVPDTANGVGTNYTLSLYTNGVLGVTNGTFAAKLPMTSMYSWLYGAYPFTNNPSAGSPRNFFDEVRTNGWTITAGEVITLQVDTNDTASFYDIDLVDLENVPAPISQPAGSVSIKSAPYNAVGDGSNDDTTALQNCITSNTSIYLPPGNYKITSLINLPSNRTIQGAGMWYTTLVGDPTLYTNSSRRVTLNGNGSNIHMSDIAIVGKLNYRNDSEPNDGLGGSFGTGSTISNMWVEHTKTGAWIVNSLGLVVNSCRFRDTIADGCNIDVGMESTTVTNCTTRGTGDDCFAMWPATYISATYSPGLNVFTHCTGQVPFLANGGAIYGGANNQIVDCLFQDIPYDCGILISTTFNVGSFTFGGTTIAQSCELNRCGGTSMGAGLQICLGTYNGGVTGLNLNNLNITNNPCDGMSIIGGSGTGGQGTLSSAIMSYVNIPNYGLGGSGRNGLWARSDAVGSLTVSNSTIVEYLNNSASFTFNFVTSNIPVTVQTSPSGLSFTVDGTNYSSTQTFNWIYGSSHTIATTSPQSGGSGTQYVWGSWSDTGAPSHMVMAYTNVTYTANFTTQYYLTMNAGAGGAVSPAGGWNNSGTNVNISATASNDYSFSGWTGSGTGSYSGGNNPASVTMSGPITETADFTPNIAVTVQTSLAGLLFAVDGTTYTNAQTFSWTPGTNHTIATTSPQSGATGEQYVWNSWSDNGAISHTIAPTTSGTYTANFTTQYYLTMNAGLGGNVSPASSWNNSNAVVGISATVSNGYSFSSWSGSGSGSYSGPNSSASVTMNGPVSETASFTQTNVEELAILAITINPDSSVTLIYATTPGFAYHVESTTNLVPASWTILPGSATNATGSSVSFTDTNAPGNPQLFYRVGSP